MGELFLKDMSVINRTDGSTLQNVDRLEKCIKMGLMCKKLIRFH